VSSVTAFFAFFLTNAASALTAAGCAIAIRDGREAAAVVWGVLFVISFAAFVAVLRRRARDRRRMD
jgi:hypothetical protein